MVYLGDRSAVGCCFGFHRSLKSSIQLYPEVVQCQMDCHHHSSQPLLHLPAQHCHWVPPALLRDQAPPLPLPALCFLHDWATPLLFLALFEVHFPPLLQKRRVSVFFAASIPMVTGNSRNAGHPRKKHLAYPSIEDCLGGVSWKKPTEILQVRDLYLGAVLCK